MEVSIIKLDGAINFVQYFYSDSIKFHTVLLFGQYQISYSTVIRTVSNFVQYCYSDSIKFRTVLLFGQYQISYSTVIRTVSNFIQYYILHPTTIRTHKFNPVRNLIRTKYTPVRNLIQTKYTPVRNLVWTKKIPYPRQLNVLQSSW